MPVTIDNDFVDGLDATNEVQYLAVGGGGAEDNTFDLNGESVAYTDDGGNMAGRLQTAADTVFGGGNVSVFYDYEDGGTRYYNFTFQASLAATNVAEMVVTNNTSGATITPSTQTQGTPATAAVQTFTFTPPPTSGSWTLDGNSFDWDETPTVDGWSVSGSPDSGTVTCTRIGVDEIQQIDIAAGGAASGTFFQLNFSGPCEYFDDAGLLQTSIQNYLDLLVYGGGGTLSAGPGADYSYTLSFSGFFAATNVDQLPISDIDTGVAMSVTTVVDGSPATGSGATELTYNVGTLEGEGGGGGSAGAAQTYYLNFLSRC
jgi:hypothetical protein